MIRFQPLGSWSRKNNRNAIAVFHFAFCKKSLSLWLKFALINTLSLFAIASGVIQSIAKSRIWFVTFSAAFQNIQYDRCIAVPGLIHDNGRRAFRQRLDSDFLWNPSAWNVQSSACYICKVRTEKNVSWSFLLLIWFCATAVNSVLVLFADLFY